MLYSSTEDEDSSDSRCELPSKKARFLLTLDAENSNDSNASTSSGKAAMSSHELKCWQTEQLARGILDNTLNSMLEHSGHAPDHVQQLLRHDREEAVEHDAVLMAIQSHGLQRFQRPAEEAPPAYHLPSSSSSSGDSILARLEHDSFLDAAVAVAIQKKGLGVFTSAADSVWRAPLEPGFSAGSGFWFYAAPTRCFYHEFLCHVVIL